MEPLSGELSFFFSKESGGNHSQKTLMSEKSAGVPQCMIARCLALGLEMCLGSDDDDGC